MVKKTNIELLRIIAMCMIIGLHYWNLKIGGGKPLNTSLFCATQSLCVCGVNLFVLITGWFSVKSFTIDVRKICRLLLDVSIWGVLGLIFACVFLMRMFPYVHFYGLQFHISGETDGLSKPM